MRLMVLLYSVCGQGHAAVVAGLCRAVLAQSADSSVVVVSGGLAPPPGCLPDEADLVQLPGYSPSVGLFSGLVPRARNLPTEVLKKTRLRVLLALLRSLRPDVVLTEHYPFGRHAFSKEIDKILAEAAGLGAQLASAFAVLGGQSAEHRNEALLLERAPRFARILVHTDPRVERLDDDYPAAAPLLASRVRYTGYVLPQAGPPQPRSQVRARLGIAETTPLLLAHAGGGRDGAALLRRVLRALPRATPASALLMVGGPSLPAAEADELEALAGRTPGARFERSRADLFDCMAAADGVVCMAGYGSAAELCAAEVPALLAPRLDEEQGRRARRLHKLGRAALLAEDADDAAVAAALSALLRTPRPPAGGIALDGAQRGAAELLALGQAAVAGRRAPAEAAEAEETG
jgi:predicted glycosyltransferase